MPKPVQAVRDRILKQPNGDRAFVELLMLAGHAGMDALTVACELALESGVISGSVVMNELRRFIAPHLSDAAIDHTAGLKALQLYGMATAWAELQAEQPRQNDRPEVWMQQLIAAEQIDRQLKSLR